mmetsp:Transcript_29890/g.85632  ORF Transcript_29890/g.85632 Transcript_29890/m.85632 type:complete len:283 (+) Transcript_29890:183-1031(+)
MIMCRGMCSTLSPRNTTCNFSRSNISGVKPQNINLGSVDRKASSEFTDRTPVAAKASAMRALDPAASPAPGSDNASTNRARPARSSSDRALHCPKSMSPTRPSGNIKMFPGCGSPLKKGQQKSWKPCTSRISRNVSLNSAVVAATPSEDEEPEGRHHLSRTSAVAPRKRNAKSIPTSLSSHVPSRDDLLTADDGSAADCAAWPPRLSLAVPTPALSANQSLRDLPFKFMPRASKRCMQTVSNFGPGKYSMPMTAPAVSSGIGLGMATRPAKRAPAGVPVNAS